MPTPLGIALGHSYMAIDPELVAPDLRSTIESSIDRIAKGVIIYTLI
jgi:DNA topoisomerase-3